MKTINKLMCLALSASLLSGCSIISNLINGGGKSSNSNNSSESGSSSQGGQSSSSSQGGSSSSSGQGGGGGGGGGQVTSWPAALQTLLTQYAGEVIPVPNNFGTAIEYDVEDDALWIDGTSSSFTIANYYQQLEAAGWSSTLDGTSHELTDPDTGDTYYECYKQANATTTYYVQYFYSDYYTANEIWAWEETMSSELTTDTDWSTEVKEDMVAAFGEVLPFQKFGSDYAWEFDGLLGMLTDSYIEDQCTAYKALLASNGFSLVDSGDYQGSYQKIVADDNVLYVSAEFSEGSGNAVLVELVPTVYAGWPTEELAALTYPYTVPQPLSGSFFWYKVNGAITATTETATEMVSDYYDLLESWNIYVNYTSYYYYCYGLLDYVMAYPWEEVIEVDFGDVYADENYETVESFFVTVMEMTPTSEFSASWPGAEIEDFLGEGAPTVPSADKVSIKDFKYYLTEDDDENPVFAVQAFDDGTPGTDAIEDTYLAKFGAGWTIDSSDYDNSGYFATDSGNNVKVQFYSYQGFFCCYIYKLSGGSGGGGGTIPTPTTTKTISPSDFSSSYTSGTKTINGLTFKYTDMMDVNVGGTHYVQLKKNTGNMYNETAYDPMVSIRFTNINRTDVITLSAGTSRSSLSAVTPIEDGNDLVYVLDGATFFEVTIAGNAIQCTSIVFGF